MVCRFSRCRAVREQARVGPCRGSRAVRGPGVRPTAPQIASANSQRRPLTPNGRRSACSAPTGRPKPRSWRSTMRPPTCASMSRAGGRQLLTGVWSSESRADGEVLHQIGGWDQVCWFTDADVDYLEFRLPLTRRRPARTTGPARPPGRVPAAGRSSAALRAGGARACLATAAGRRASDGTPKRKPAMRRCRPASRSHGSCRLALPEWRADPRVGELTLADGAMRLAERGHARALACPLFIDLNPRRARQALHLAAAHRGRVAAHLTGRRGRGLSRPVRPRPVGLLPLASRSAATARCWGRTRRTSSWRRGSCRPSGAIEELVEVQG